MMRQDNIHTSTSQKRRSFTQKSSSVTPNDIDILCGRGCTYVHRAGNKAFGATVQAHLQEYNDALTRIDKTMVVAAVLDIVLESGARFLKKLKGSDTEWVQMTREEAHSKVGHAIRDTIRNTGKVTRACTPPAHAGPIRRYHSAGAIKDSAAKTSPQKRRSRSLADVMAAFKPKVADIDESEDDLAPFDDLRVSIQSVSSNIIDDVLKTVNDIESNDDDDIVMETCIDSPLPDAVPSNSLLHNEDKFDSTPLRVSSASACAELWEHEDLANMCDALFE
jgi:hypothetical protein